MYARILALAVSFTFASSIGSPLRAQHDSPHDILLSVVADGTAAFDGDDTQGNDSSPNNSRVRTLDEITYRIDWNTNHLQSTVVEPTNEVTILTQLPSGATWATELPAACRTQGVLTPSSLSVDGRTLTCNLGSVPEGSAGVIFPTALVGAVAEGTVISLTASISDSDNNTATSNQIDITVTALPSWNLRKQDRQALVRELEDPQGNEGFIVVWPITLEAGSPSGKGVEAIQGSFQFDDDLSDIFATFPNARLLDFAPAIGGPITDCGPTDIFAETAPWGRLGISPAADSTNSTADSGTWSCNLNGTTLEISVTGADFTSGVVPTNSTTGMPLTPRGIVVSGQVALFLPISDLNNMPGTYSLTNTVTNFQATSLSNAPVTDSNPTDNSETTNVVYTISGFISPETGLAEGAVFLTRDWFGRGQVELPGFTNNGVMFGMPGQSANVPSTAVPIVPGTGTDLAHSGDGLKNAGGTFIGATAIQGEEGALSKEGDYSGLCIRFDNTRSRLAPTPDGPYIWADQATFFNSGGQQGILGEADHPDSGNFAYGELMVGGQQFVTDRLTEGVAYEIEYGSSADPTNWVMAANEPCNDADSPDGWVTDPNSLPGGIANVSKVRLRWLQPRLGDVISDEANRLVIGLEALPFDINADAMKGDIIPIFSSYSFWSGSVWDGDETWISEGYDPIAHQNASGMAVGEDGGGDRIHLVPELIFINKTVNDSKVALANRGDIVDFEIEVELVGGSLIPVDDIEVVDTLPPELEFIEGSASSTTGVTPVESPAGTLTWDFGSVVPGTTLTLQYQARVALSAPSLSTFANQVVVTGDPVRLPQLLAPVPGNNSGAAVATPGSISQFRIDKRIQQSLIAENGVLVYELAYTNPGDSALGQLDAIDVFPFNGDGLGSGAGTDRIEDLGPSSFSGTLSLQAITPANGEELLLSSAPPASVRLDPSDPSNMLPGGATQWCEVTDNDPQIPNLGDPGCPVAMADATAARIRMQTGDMLLGGEERTLSLTFLTSDNQPGDIYTNNYGARIDGIVFETVSNDISALIVRPELGDRIWYDLDGNGTQDPGEAGIPGVTVTITGTDGMGGAVSVNAITDANGEYLFDLSNVPNLGGGSYTLTVSGLPAGLQPTFDLDGINTPDSASVMLGVTESRRDADFGYQPSGSISGTLYHDQDGDATQGTGEPGLPGVQVGLYEADGTTPVLDSQGSPLVVTTDGSGNYTFPALLGGDYVIQVDPSGTTLPATLTGTEDPDGVVDQLHAVTLPPGGAVADRNFGFEGDLGLYAIPTLSPWGLLTFVLLLLGASLRKRRATPGR